MRRLKGHGIYTLICRSLIKKFFYSWRKYYMFAFKLDSWFHLAVLFSLLFFSKFISCGECVNVLALFRDPINENKVLLHALTWEPTGFIGKTCVFTFNDKATRIKLLQHLHNISWDTETLASIAINENFSSDQIGDFKVIHAFCTSRFTIKEDSIVITHSEPETAPTSPITAVDVQNSASIRDDLIHFQHTSPGVITEFPFLQTENAKFEDMLCCFSRLESTRPFHVYDPSDKNAVVRSSSWHRLTYKGKEYFVHTYPIWSICLFKAVIRSIEVDPPLNSHNTVAVPAIAVLLICFMIYWSLLRAPRNTAPVKDNKRHNNQGKSRKLKNLSH